MAFIIFTSLTLFSFAFSLRSYIDASFKFSWPAYSFRSNSMKVTGTYPLPGLGKCLLNDIRPFIQISKACRITLAVSRTVFSQPHQIPQAFGLNRQNDRHLPHYHSVYMHPGMYGLYREFLSSVPASPIAIAAPILPLSKIRSFEEDSTVEQCL